MSDELDFTDDQERAEYLAKLKEEILGIKVPDEKEAERMVDRIVSKKEKIERIKKQHKKQLARLTNELNTLEYVFNPLLMEYFEAHKGKKNSIHLPTGTISSRFVGKSVKCEKAKVLSHIYGDQVDFEALKQAALEGAEIPGITVTEEHRTFTVN